MICAKCGKENGKATMFRETGTTNILKLNPVFYIGADCGCFWKWLKFLKEKDPNIKIEKKRWGASIIFSKGIGEANELAKEFADDFVKVQFT
jgi:hypothetical protein